MTYKYTESSNSEQVILMLINKCDIILKANYKYAGSS